jgi:hypothetical protein
MKSKFIFLFIYSIILSESVNCGSFNDDNDMNLNNLDGNNYYKRLEDIENSSHHTSPTKHHKRNKLIRKGHFKGDQKEKEKEKEEAKPKHRNFSLQTPF